MPPRRDAIGREIKGASQAARGHDREADEAGYDGLEANSYEDRRKAQNRLAQRRYRERLKQGGDTTTSENKSKDQPPPTQVSTAPSTRRHSAADPATTSAPLSESADSGVALLGSQWSGPEDLDALAIPAMDDPAPSYLADFVASPTAALWDGFAQSTQRLDLPAAGTLDAMASIPEIPATLTTYERPSIRPHDHLQSGPAGPVPPLPEAPMIRQQLWQDNAAVRRDLIGDAASHMETLPQGINREAESSNEQSTTSSSRSTDLLQSLARKQLRDQVQAQIAELERLHKLCTELKMLRDETDFEEEVRIIRERFLPLSESLGGEED